MKTLMQEPPPVEAEVPPVTKPVDPGKLAASKNPRAVRQMFERIAPTYDLLNHLLSANTDRRWRAETAATVVTERTRSVLDVCAGTGDLVFAIEEEARRKAARPTVVGVDFAPAMLTRARRKWRKRLPRDRSLETTAFAAADASSLPFCDATFDLVTVAFGIRNVSSIELALSEMARVCRHGGRVAVLEFSEAPPGFLGLAYRFYFHCLLPLVGRLVTWTSSYRYLPRSVAAFPSCGQFAELMEKATGGAPEIKTFSRGIATLYVARVNRLRPPAGRISEPTEAVPNTPATQ